MLFFLFLTLLPGLLRGILATHFDLSIIGSHLTLLIPDVVFFGTALYWMFRKEQKKPTIALSLFCLTFLGSIVWDYQPGFIFLKLIFPALLFFILNQKEIEQTTIKEIGKSVFLLLLVFPIPFFLFGTLMRALKARSLGKKDDHSIPSKAIAIGLTLATLLILLLTQLDPDFGTFLNIKQWWEIAAKSIGSTLLYLGTFILYFFLPVKSVWRPKEDLHHLKTLLSAGVIIIITILAAYTLYDSYILLRAFRLMALTFETIGKNTQMNFLELVLLGGGLLFTVSYILDKLLATAAETTTKRRVKTLLLLSLVWLLPPLYNIGRVLFWVYIPQFGLTALRLFGIYTMGAFLLAVGIVVGTYMTNKKYIFTKSFLGFLLPLVVFSFVLPNNLIITQWHLTNYFRGASVDFDYIQKLRLQKWGFLFLPSFHPETYPVDALWMRALGQGFIDKGKADALAQQIEQLVNQDIANIRSRLATQQFTILRQEYLEPNAWVYEGPPIGGLTITLEPHTFTFTKYQKEELPLIQSTLPYLQYHYVYGATRHVPNKPDQFTQGRRDGHLSLSLKLDRNTHHVVKIKSDGAPFWVYDLSSTCTSQLSEFANRGSFEQFCSEYVAKGKTLTPQSIPFELFESYLYRQLPPELPPS